MSALHAWRSFPREFILVCGIRAGTGHQVIYHETECANCKLFVCVDTQQEVHTLDYDAMKSFRRLKKCSRRIEAVRRALSVSSL